MDLIFENPVIINAVEIDGVVSPPILVACHTCMYCRESNVYDIDEAVICNIKKIYVDSYDWCSEFELNTLAIPDEVEDYIEEHPEYLENYEEEFELLEEDKGI